MNRSDGYVSNSSRQANANRNNGKSNGLLAEDTGGGTTVGVLEDIRPRYFGVMMCVCTVAMRCAV